MAEAVNHPEHYGGDTPYEVIKVLEAWNPILTYGFCWGNAIKYVSRADKKDPSKATEDLEKSQWYSNKAREIRERLEAKGMVVPTMDAVPGIDQGTAAKLQHLADLYRALGAEWGKDPFAAIRRLRADTDWEEVEDLVATLHSVRVGLDGGQIARRAVIDRIIQILETIYHTDA